MSDNVIKFPPPRRFIADDYQDENGDWKWKVLEVTGEEKPVYVVGEEDPWCGVSIEELIEECLDEVHGYDDMESFERAELNCKLYKQAEEIKKGMKV